MGNITYPGVPSKRIVHDYSRGAPRDIVTEYTYDESRNFALLSMETRHSENRIEKINFTGERGLETPVNSELVASGSASPSELSRYTTLGYGQKYLKMGALWNNLIPDESQIVF